MQVLSVASPVPKMLPLVGVLTVPLCESNAQKSIPIKSGRESSLGIEQQNYQANYYSTLTAMKTLLFILSFILGITGCTKTEIVKEPFIPCDCKDLPIIYEYKGLKGMIIFPNSIRDSYGIIVSDFSSGELTPYFGVCTDSIFINLIKAKKISDSTFVKFDGGGINGQVSCKWNGAVRITNLEKY